MKYSVTIKCNATGEIKVMPQDLDWDECSDFWWTEGNFGCDCNRRSVFVGKYIEDSPCGNTAYMVINAILQDGMVIEIDGYEKNSDIY